MNSDRRIIKTWASRVKNLNHLVGSATALQRNLREIESLASDMARVLLDFDRRMSSATCNAATEIAVRQAVSEVSRLMARSGQDIKELARCRKK